MYCVTDVILSLAFALFKQQSPDAQEQKICKMNSTGEATGPVGRPGLLTVEKVSMYWGYI